MPHPTSLRLPETVKNRLERSAAETRQTASALAVRLIDEGLRMNDHPGITFHDSPAHGRVACLAGGPDIAEVIDVLLGLDARGDERITEAATWFAIHPSRVRIAVGYYTAFQDEIDHQIALRRREAAELRGRYEAEQSLVQ